MGKPKPSGSRREAFFAARNQKKKADPIARKPRKSLDFMDFQADKIILFSF